MTESQTCIDVYENGKHCTCQRWYEPAPGSPQALQKPPVCKSCEHIRGAHPEPLSNPVVESEKVVKNLVHKFRKKHGDGDSTSRNDVEKPSHSEARTEAVDGFHRKSGDNREKQSQRSTSKVIREG